MMADCLLLAVALLSDFLTRLREPVARLHQLLEYVQKFYNIAQLPDIFSILLAPSTSHGAARWPSTKMGLSNPKPLLKRRLQSQTFRIGKAIPVESTALGLGAWLIGETADLPAAQGWS
jgi:hypothetical protein